MTLISGAELTVIGSDATEVQPEAESVNVNVAVPALIPVTIPVLLIVATLVLLLVHTPPDDGVKLVVAPSQMATVPVIVATGFACTISSEDCGETQPVADEININLTVPIFIPVTIPALVTCATVGFVLVQVPPEVGDNVVVEPIHIGLLPVISEVGRGLTVTKPVGSELHPVEEDVKINEDVPADIP